MRPPATRRLRSMFSRDRYRRPCRTPRSPFDFTADEWIALGEVLRRTKQAWDERLEPDGYGLYWTSFPSTEAEVAWIHAHLHVVPRFDDEPHAAGGGRVGIKGDDNRRPDPRRPGTGRARLFGT
jgi:diadenosine tetraphosphate (Ap4A) HIT family hydrolase